MDERRKHQRTRARIPCELIVSATGKRYAGHTKSLSLGGAEFEAAESLTRPGRAVAAGSVGLLSLMVRKGGRLDVLKVPCRIRYLAANSAGLEFTAAFSLAADKAILEYLVATGSNRLD